MNAKKIRPGPGRPSQIKNPRDTICAAAAKAFSAKGYDGTSLQDVAERVGITKAGLYHYFPSKAALFEAIVLDTLNAMILSAKCAIEEQGTQSGKLTAFMVAHARYFELHGDQYRASFFERGSGSDYTSEQLEARREYTRLLEGILDAAVRNGEMVVENVPIQARGILGMLNWMSRWYRQDGEHRASEVAEIYARTILSGLIVT